MSDLQSNKKNRIRRRRKIKFDEEVVSKEESQKLVDKFVKKHKQKPKKLKKQNGFDANVPTIKESSESVETIQTVENIQSVENIHSVEKEIKKKKKRKLETNDVVERNNEATETNSEEINTENNEDEEDLKEPVESIRSKKRKKHQHLLEEKKLKSELNLQQKCLNYLSQWKHSRSTWKFEKLKQVWIQQNMFSESRIPNEIWETVVEYFNNSKGKIKSIIIAEALKIVEGSNEDENEDKSEDVKYKRARYVIQNLQE